MLGIYLSGLIAAFLFFVISWFLHPAAEADSVSYIKES